MYKGYKVTKHLQRYMGYAKDKYEKLTAQGEADLWEIIEEYDIFMEQAKCVQMYVYDWVKGRVEQKAYTVVCARNGCVYVRELKRKSA